MRTLSIVMLVTLGCGGEKKPSEASSGPAPAAAPALKASGDKEPFAASQPTYQLEELCALLTVDEVKAIFPSTKEIVRENGSSECAWGEGNHIDLRIRNFPRTGSVRVANCRFEKEGSDLAWEYCGDKLIKLVMAHKGRVLMIQGGSIGFPPPKEKLVAVANALRD